MTLATLCRSIATKMLPNVVHNGPRESGNVYDYTHGTWGHDLMFHGQDDRGAWEVSGWGPALSMSAQGREMLSIVARAGGIVNDSRMFGGRIGRGDVLLRGMERPDGTTYTARLIVDEVSYHSDPHDMFFARLVNLGEEVQA